MSPQRTSTEDPGERTPERGPRREDPGERTPERALSGPLRGDSGRGLVLVVIGILTRAVKGEREDAVKDDGHLGGPEREEKTQRKKVEDIERRREETQRGGDGGKRRHKEEGMGERTKKRMRKRTQRGGDGGERRHKEEGMEERGDTKRRGWRRDVERKANETRKAMST
ncbi:hypothetical protein NHX12_028809 [Muraenolepis orangiensis]|uniref:Uncharacterized protein n=1 Tax=Muraenolepis orangiensis TaxID=630683 RepID=A0A9Q0EEF8_9TELE|nr:hypothetical protein NHX12_028809 [Muraenolepis orangiensis]